MSTTIEELVERLGITSSVMEDEGRHTHSVTVSEAASTLTRMAEENERLRKALIDARENIIHWAGYVGDYFREKHDYVGDLAAIDAALEAKP